ncbi:hypothetical protein [Streptococcus ruminantium]|uniref:hypothetical protein n=1 Tax=Streptococcus ruminantium TaxID=1917441 RepID=UPI0012DF661E|nr:hypothetical protein [Streptococcus ruminantium]BDD40417.1 hypothetical protein GUT184_06810 [Streptococcus ruminantium]
MLKRSKEEFYGYLSAVYSLSEEEITPILREKILGIAQELDKSENIYLIADRLGRYVNAELTALTCHAPKELVNLALYIQKLQNHYRRSSIIPGIVK